MVSAVAKALQRVQGLIWGAGTRDSSVYFDGHTVVADVVGRDAGVAGFLVRGLDTVNAPTELFRVNKDGSVSWVGQPIESFNYPTLQAAIDAAPTGGVVRVSADTTVTVPVTITKALTLFGEGAAITQATDDTTLFSVSASDVTIRGLTLVGRGSDVDTTGLERAVSAEGASAAAPIARVRVLGCRIRDWGQFGVRLKWVTDFEVCGNHISDIYHSGIIGYSVQRGRIEANHVETVIASESYGIIVTRATTDSIVTDPRSSDIVITGNLVRGVANWEGIDTHGGERISIVGNVVQGSLIGISVTYAPTLTGSVPTWAPKDCTVVGNVIDSGSSAGTGSYGIVVSGASVSAGVYTELAENIVVVGNTVKRHGDEDNANLGAILFQATIGVVCGQNVVVEPCPHGIVFYIDNYGFNCSGNTVVDPWTTAGAEAVAVYVRAGYNSGYVGAITAVEGTKVATRTLDHAVNVANQANNAVQVGPIYTTAPVRLYDPGLKTSSTVDAVVLNLGTAQDVVLQREAADVLAQRRGATAQTSRIYNTWTSATSYERGYLGWVGNTFQIGTEKGSGGGTARSLGLYTDGVARWIVGATGHLLPNADNSFDVGAAGNSMRRLHIAGYQEITEIGDPAAPSANKARLYCRDNGSGKTQIVALFPSGAVQIMATEP